MTELIGSPAQIKQYWPWTQSGSGNLLVQYSVSEHILSMQEHQRSSLKPLLAPEEDESQIFASQMEGFLFGQDDSSVLSL